MGILSQEKAGSQVKLLLSGGLKGEKTMRTSESKLEGK